MTGFSRNAIVVATLFLVPHQAASITPRNAAVGVAYVGSKICAGCHPDIAAPYRQTSMGRSMAHSESPVVAALPAPFTVFDNENGEFFQVMRKPDGLYQSQYALDKDGKEIFRQTWRLAYSIGTGQNGFGFLIERNGFLFEAPLTYYSKSQVWSFSPGYEVRNLAFTRPILPECLGCHSGRFQALYGTAGQFREPPFLEEAVGCENCHGPGGLHVAERRAAAPLKNGGDSSIVNPIRLSGWLSDNICMKCHQGGDVRVAQAGKHDEDFRPGTPLDNVISIFKMPLKEQSPSSRQVLLEHYFSMSLSQCYRASAGRLRCTTCHDPHSEPSAESAATFYRAKCLSCHQTNDCKEASSSREKTIPSDNCGFCHMPKAPVTTITHAALTDHRIAKRPDEPLPPSALVSDPGADTGLIQLTLPPGGQASNPTAITLLRAYSELVRNGDADFVPRLHNLLDSLPTALSNNPVVLSALARRVLSQKSPQSAEAVSYLERSLAAGSADRSDELLLAQLYAANHRNDSAISILQKASQANPYVPEFVEALASQYVALGQYRTAQSTIEKGLQLFPEDRSLRQLKAKVESASLNDLASPK